MNAAAIDLCSETTQSRTIVGDPTTAQDDRKINIVPPPGIFQNVLPQHTPEIQAKAPYITGQDERHQGVAAARIRTPHHDTNGSFVRGSGRSPQFTENPRLHKILSHNDSTPQYIVFFLTFLSTLDRK